jgi:hypothetical protein
MELSEIKDGGHGEVSAMNRSKKKKRAQAWTSYILKLFSEDALFS